MIDKAAEIAEHTARLRLRVRTATRSLRRVLEDAEALGERARQEAEGSYGTPGSWRRVSGAALEARAFAGQIRGALDALGEGGNP